MTQTATAPSARSKVKSGSGRVASRRKATPPPEETVNEETGEVLDFWDTVKVDFDSATQAIIVTVGERSWSTAEETFVPSDDIDALNEIMAGHAGVLTWWVSLHGAAEKHASQLKSDYELMHSAVCAELRDEYEKPVETRIDSEAKRDPRVMAMKNRYLDAVGTANILKGIAEGLKARTTMLASLNANLRAEMSGHS